MGFFNSGGLITRGYGDDHRIITRGYGVRFDFGGVRFRRVSKEYFSNIFAPILKEEFWEIEIYSPLEIRKNRIINFISGFSKEIKENLNIFINLDYSKLSEVLDAI